MDSQGVKIAMWQEILHNIRCLKRSYLSVRIVKTFLGMKQKINRKGWIHIDKFMEENGMKPDQHFCRDICRGFRCGITFEAFVLLLYGGKKLRDKSLTNKKQTEENIRWLQNHLLSLLRHSILIASAGINLGDESGFFHFDKDKHTIGGIANNTTAATLSTGELAKKEQPTKSSCNNGTEQHESVREELEASGNLERQNCLTASIKNESATSSDSEGHQTEPVPTTFSAGNSEIQSGMHLERTPHDKESESDISMRNHVQNESRSQLKRLSLKSINQKYRCKFCQRRFQRNRLGFLIFRRHVKNHEKRYVACRYRSSVRQQNFSSEFKSESSDTLQRDEASTEINQNICDDVERDTKSGCTSSVVIDGNVCGEPSVVPTWNAAETRSVTDSVSPNLSITRFASKVSKVVDKDGLRAYGSCSGLVHKTNVSYSGNDFTSMSNGSSNSSEACSIRSDFNHGISAATECNTKYNRTSASTTGNVSESVSQISGVIDSQLHSSTSVDVTICMNTTGQGPSLPTLRKSSSAPLLPDVRNGTPVHECFLCHKKFSSKDSWKEHMKIHNKSQSYTCAVKHCGLVFHTKMSLEDHVQKRHKKQRWCDVCLKPVNRFKTHMRIHTVKSCPYCPEKFTRKNEYRKHVTNHERQCKYCDKIFKFTPAKVEHEKAVHENKVQYKCDMCGKEFVHRRDFGQHKKTDACIARKCRLCGKIYKNRCFLKSHMKYSHNGFSRRKRCKYCPETFTDRTALINHRNTHTDDEKKKLCKACGNFFIGMHGLYRHEQEVHSGQQTFCCEICGKMSTSRKNLEVHRRVHTGERPYKCLQCGKGFVNSSNLKQHSYTHTGENPFQCTTCKKNFRSVKSLKAHKEIMHPSDEKS